MEYIISDKTLNKIIGIIEDKPFKIVINLLNEIQAVPFSSGELIVDSGELSHESEAIGSPPNNY